MFAFDRSALAVLVPLALLVAVVVLSNQGSGTVAPQQANAETGPRPLDEDRDAAKPPAQTVAANLPSR